MIRLSVFLPSVGIAHERLERDALRTGCRDTHVATAHGPLLGGFARDAFVADDHERVAGRRHVRETHDLDRNRRSGFLDLFALVVDQRADFAERSA